MPLVSALILPHGTMTFDGDLSLNGDDKTMASDRIRALPSELRKECTILFKSCQEAVKVVEETSPEVVFLNTPHGISLSNSMGVYTNPSAKGNSEWNDQWHEYTVDITLDLELSEGVIKQFQADGIPVEGITTFSRFDSPLRWGETVPLWFLKPITDKGIRVVMISNPTCLKAKQSVAEISIIGKSIRKYINGLSQRVLYVCSGDLAHTHKHNHDELTLYTPSPKWGNSLKYHSTGLPYDLTIEYWMKAVLYTSGDITGPAKTIERATAVWNSTTILEAKQWLDRALILRGTALSCGFNGFCILQGIVETEIEQGRHFNINLFCRLAPTYYGMAAASFINQQETV